MRKLVLEYANLTYSVTIPEHIDIWNDYGRRLEDLVDMTMAGLETLFGLIEKSKQLNNEFAWYKSEIAKDVECVFSMDGQTTTMDSIVGMLLPLPPVMRKLADDKQLDLSYKNFTVKFIPGEATTK